MSSHVRKFSYEKYVPQGNEHWNYFPMPIMNIWVFRINQMLTYNSLDNKLKNDTPYE